MQKHINAAKRALRSDQKSIFFYASGDDARLLTSNGPWKSLAKAGGHVAIILPPFAEEMNRCRRLISLTQDALSQVGICSIGLDYYGTGDSAGDFANARLAHWEKDVEDACRLAKDAGANAITLVGVRFGALLAAHLAHRIPLVETVFAVAPQESFQRAIRQFIRIASTTQDPSSTDQPGLRTPGAAKRLDAGETVEIGGYQLSPALYRDFMTVKRTQPSNLPITLFFVGNQPPKNDALSAQENRQYQAFQHYGETIHHQYVKEAQMWYQGIPDEPVALPRAIATTLKKRQMNLDCDDAA